MNQNEQRAVLSVCLLAALADGSQSEAERAQVQKVAEVFHQDPALGDLAKDVIERRPPLAEVVRDLQSSEAKALAYEMAVGVCGVDGANSPDEQQFLNALRSELHLERDTTHQIQNRVDELLDVPPVITQPARVPETDGQSDEMILNAAILTGALELLPHSMATMAIIPVQMRLVYRLGQARGFQLDRSHIAEFLGAVGIGLTSQVVEGFARKLVSGFGRQLAGGVLGSLAGVATGSAVAFATTYALGQLAKRYYAEGRTLNAAQLRDAFRSLLEQGKALQPRYANQIVGKSNQLQASDLLPLIRQG